MEKIFETRMCDLLHQYLKISPEINLAIAEVVTSSAYINGPKVQEFSDHLAGWLNVRHVVPCGNGTDALQIALMGLGLQPGDEVVVPAFTYVSSAEVIALLGLTPVLADVDPHTFNMNADHLRAALSERTRAVIPVHLFGQSCEMGPILETAREHGLYVIEDNAQAMGALCRLPDGSERHTGTMGTVGCTSFFPTKNLGCFGDGGAMTTDDDELAVRLKMIANHGQQVKYHHSVIGCNSRLDTLQAAILDVKLRYLSDYNRARREAAYRYNEMLQGLDWVLELPQEAPWSSHVYHQYTLKVRAGATEREALRRHLQERGVPTMVYYPLPLQDQEAFRGRCRLSGPLSVSRELADQVLSLPMHTELCAEEQAEIAAALRSFYK